MPMALGHEASGIVDSVGAWVTHFSPGDRVVINQGSAVKIDPSIPLDPTALLGCAVLTGAGATLHTGDLRPGQSCAIVGLGGVGLSGLLAALAAGAHPVIAVDLAADKRDFALDLGVHHAVDPAAEGAVEEIQRLTGGGVHLAVELAGSARALRFAYDIVRRGGTAVTAGLPHPSEELSIPATSLTVSEKVLKGSYVGSCVPLRDIPRFADLMTAGALPIERLMTHRLELEEINEGFECELTVKRKDLIPWSYPDPFCVSTIWASKTSAGVRHPRHLRGVELRRWQIDLRNRFVSAVGPVERGRYLRSLLLVFSTVPFCQGAWGSQNQLSAPIPAFRCDQAENSVPRSKVMDCRASAGRGARPSISASMIGLDWRSSLRRTTTYRLTRSTSDVTLTLPWSLRNSIRSHSQCPNSCRSATQSGLRDRLWLSKTRVR